MSDTGAVLAIDQGTSSTKAAVVSSDGALVSVAEAPLERIITADGGIEQDPEAILQSLVIAASAALELYGGRVDAVGLANQGETIIAWDRETGNPLSPAVSWQDRRSLEVCQRMAVHASRLHEITGLRLDPYFAAPKMRWMRDHVTTLGVVTTTDAWLLHRLTGGFVTDATTASRTLLLDVDRGQWSAEACNLFEIDMDHLPEVVDSVGALGETSIFGSSLPVTAAVVDQQAALFAESCLDAGDTKCTYGTGAFLLVNTGRERVFSRDLVSCIAWRLNGATTFCLDGQVYTAGAAVAWLHELGIIADASDLDTCGRMGQDEAPIFVPALTGVGAPFWRADARGAFIGLTLATSRFGLISAVIEAIAASVTLLAQTAAHDTGVPLAALRVDGGLTRSHTLLQTQADLLQLPIEVYPHTHATALGIAALCHSWADPTASLVDLTGQWSPAAVYEPEISADHAAARIGRWRQAVDMVMDH